MDDEDELDAMIAARGGPSNVVKLRPVEPLPFLTLTRLSERAQAVQWLVKGAVPAESIGMFFGASGTFKSFLALDLALHIAHGMQWLGKKTKQGPVVIIAAEGGAGIWWRIKAWHQLHGMRWDKIPLYVVPVAVDLLTDAPRVCEAAASARVVPALVVVDTMAQTFRGEENSASEVGSYLSEIGLWFRQSWQCAVLVVHHTGHEVTERPRGSSALRGNVDWMFGVYRDAKEMLATLECVKQKDAEIMPASNFSLDLIDLGTDTDGDKITSLACHCLSAEKIASAVEYETSRGRGGNRGLFLELALNGIEEKKLRTIFYEAIDGAPDKKRQAYFRCRKWAIDARICEFAEGYVIRLGA